MLALVILYSDNTIRKAMPLFFSLGTLTYTNVNCIAHFCITLFGVAVRGKASLNIAWIGNSVLGELQGTI